MNLELSELKSRLKPIIFGPFLSIEPPPLNLFLWSVIGAFSLSFALAFLNVFFGDGFAIVPRSKILDAVTFHWLLDPTTMHVVVALLASYLIYSQAKYIKGADKWSRIASTAGPFLILIGIFILGDLVVKPAFGVVRPPDPLAEPPITKAFRELLAEITGTNPGYGDSMPSGFVMRQTALTLIVAWQVTTKTKKISRLRKILIMVVAIMAFFVVSFSRVYRGAHSGIDVVAAIGVGTLIFWIMVLPLYNLIALRSWSIHKVHLSPLAAGSLLLFFVLLPFSDVPARMIQIFSIYIIFLGTIYMVSPLIRVYGITVLPRDLYSPGGVLNKAK